MVKGEVGRGGLRALKVERSEGLQRGQDAVQRRARTESGGRFRVVRLIVTTNIHGLSLNTEKLLRDLLFARGELRRKRGEKS